MKANERNDNSQSIERNTNENRLHEERLYNLVFSGKITLKEYLQGIKTKKGQTQAA